MREGVGRFKFALGHVAFTAFQARYPVYKSVKRTHGLKLRRPATLEGSKDINTVSL